MKSVEVIARSVEEAIAESLEKLNTSEDEVEVEVLEEGTKGLFGLIGSKQARVRVKRKPTLKWKLEISQEFTEELLEKMGVPAKVRSAIEDSLIKIDISGEDLGLLIGRKGQTLNSLQYLVGLAVNREGGDWSRVIVDVEGYRTRREESLKSLASRLASKALSTGRRVALEPMNAQERRIVHNSLQEVAEVETHSEGRDPFRRVIIVPKKA